jgi:type I restriction enzyme, S subunit
MLNQRMLLSNLNLLATAPGGVARLRELILTLAVQGKLVPQDPSDEPASKLLKKIRVEKDRLIAEGKIKRDKPLAEITDEEKPFALPEGWTFCRLGELLLSIRSGGTPSKENPDFWNGSIPWASVKDSILVTRFLVHKIELLKLAWMQAPSWHQLVRF